MWSIAVRRRDGAVVTESHATSGGASFVRWPFARGVVGLVQTIAVGLDAIGTSIRITTGTHVGRAEVATTLGSLAATFMLLFVAGPGLALGATSLHGVGADAAEAALRVAMLFVYLALVYRSSAARELFAYHGAEHKTIAAYEQLGMLPQVRDARRFGPVHDRCGTNFIVLFAVVSGLVYSFVSRTPLVIGAVVRIVLVPVVAALAYEAMRAAARDHTLRFLVWPGRLAQRLTTCEPADAQLEVACAALERLLQA